MKVNIPSSPTKNVSDVCSITLRATEIALFTLFRQPTAPTSWVTLTGENQVSFQNSLTAFHPCSLLKEYSTFLLSSLWQCLDRPNGYPELNCYTTSLSVIHPPLHSVIATNTSSKYPISTPGVSMIIESRETTVTPLRWMLVF